MYLIIDNCRHSYSIVLGYPYFCMMKNGKDIQHDNTFEPFLTASPPRTWRSLDLPNETQQILPTKTSTPFPSVPEEVCIIAFYILFNVFGVLAQSWYLENTAHGESLCDKPILSVSVPIKTRTILQSKIFSSGISNTRWSTSSGFIITFKYMDRIIWRDGRRASPVETSNKEINGLTSTASVYFFNPLTLYASWSSKAWSFVLK